MLVIRIRMLYCCLVWVIFLLNPALQAEEARPGLIVMAHGGNPDWNAAVEEAVRPLRPLFPVAIAFGMAQPEPLQKAVDILEAQGVTHMAVVRLFISPQSFRQQTEYLLGLDSDPPSEYLEHQLSGSGHSHHRIRIIPGDSAPPPIRRRAAVVLNQQGLYDSSEVGEILWQRIQALSINPNGESVLIIAHGEGDNAMNREWVTKLAGLASRVEQSGPFREVRVETLREDWREKRLQAERRIRDFVQQGNQAGVRVLVVPFRVFGFGPYAEVLEGLDYVSDGLGILPHPAVTDWIRLQAQDCFRRTGLLLDPAGSSPDSDRFRRGAFQTPELSR